MAAGSGAEEEELVFFVRVEGFDLLAALRLRYAPVDAAACPAAEMGGVRLDYVECRLELGEDEHLVAEREEAGEEAVEEQHFARRGDEGLVEV